MALVFLTIKNSKLKMKKIEITNEKLTLVVGRFSSLAVKSLKFFHSSAYPLTRLPAFFLLTVLFLISTSNFSLLTAFNLAPYYDFQFTEGVSIPSKGGDPTFTINLLNDIGLIVKSHEKHSTIGFFELKYLGPGLKTQEGERFTDRYLDYLYLLRHNWKIKEKLTLRAQFDYMKENRRTGANEAWGYGLYDYNRIGGLVGVEKEFEKFKLGGSIDYHYLEFPNYTDLLKEFQAGTGEAESEAGKQNHNIIQVRGDLVYGLNKFNVGFALQSYTKQKVITDTVQSDGSYYSDTLQKDIIISLTAERTQKVSNRIVFVPSISFKMRDSNQNYQHFESAGSTSPVSYQSNYYDYSEVIFSLPVNFSLSKKWDFVFSPEFDYKFYSDRQPRDASNQFIEGEKQNIMLTLLTLGFTKKATEVSSLSIFYTYQVQSSNMKFEKYLPYNYDGHFIGLKYAITY